MPQYEATLSDGRVVTLEGDHQPTEEEVMQAVGGQPAQEEQPKTSAAGAAARGFGAAVGPTTAAMAAFPGGAEVGGALGTFGGPLSPITVPAGALLGGGVAAGLAAFGVSKAQENISEALAPQTMEKLKKLRDADIVQHPVATAAGDIAAMLPSAEFAPLRTTYGLAKVPAFLRGTANEVDAQLAKGAVTQIGAQAALQTGQSLATEHKLPSAQELAEGAVAATLFHEPRFRLLPKATAAAAAAITEKGKSLYASKDQKAAEVHGDVRTQQPPTGQLPEQEGGAGVQPQAAGGLAQEAQIPLKPGDKGHRFAKVTGDKDKGFTIHWQGQTQSGFKTMNEAMMVADKIEGGERKLKPDKFTAETAQTELGIPRQPSGQHIQELTPEEIDEMEKQQAEEKALDEKRLGDLDAAAKRLKVNLKVHDNPAPGDVPFAGRGRMAWMDKKTGTMNVNRARLNRWLSRVPEEQHSAAIESLVDEEHIHSFVSDKDALDYWNNLTFVEKLLVNRRYTGRWQGLPEEFSPTNMGDEAIRGRLQQLNHMTPRELTDAVGEEHWTLRAVYALEKIIARIRESLGTNASLKQQEILGRVQRNIDLAKGILAPVAPTKTGPAAFDRNTDELESIAKEIGFEVKRNDFPGMSAAGMPPEMLEKMRQVVQPVWEFTNRKSPEDDPMGGHTFYVPEGASRADIIRRYNEIRKQYGQPPEAYDRRIKETDRDKAIRDLHEAQINESAVRRRQEQQFAVNPQEIDDAKDKLRQAWENVLDRKYPQAFDRNYHRYEGASEKDFYSERARIDDYMVLVDGKEVGGDEAYAAKLILLQGTDWAEQHLKDVEAGKYKEFPGVDPALRRIVGKKIEAGPEITPPPEEPGQRQFPFAFDRRAAEEAKRRRIAERSARKYGQRGETGQSEFFMPPSAEKWVEPISAEQGGAIMGMTPSEIGEQLPGPKMTSLELSGVHGIPGRPDRPGLVDDYLNEPIKFSAAPRTREAEVQGKAKEFTEFRRRSERPSFKGFVELAQERFHSHITEDKLREIWTDAVWRHLENASPDQLIDWAKSSRKKALASWQTGTQEELRKRLQGAVKEPEPEFGLETQVHGETEKEVAKRKRIEQREQAQAVSLLEKKANKNWATIVDEISKELFEEAKPPEQPVEREQIALDDLDYGNEGTTEGVVRDIAPNEGRDPQILASILADQSRAFPDAQNRPVSHTKRLVAILDRQTGRVHLVSSYPHGRSGAVVVDPEKAGISERPNIPLRDLFARKFGTEGGPQDRYQGIQSLLLDNPVKNFIQSFKDASTYFDDIGREAAENARAQEYSEWTGESVEQPEQAEERGEEELPDRPRGTGVEEGEGGGAQGPNAILVTGPQGIGKSLLRRTMRQSVQASEVLALQNFVLEQTGGEVTEEGMQAALQKAINGGYRGAERKTVAAIVKAFGKAYEDYQKERRLAIEARRGAPEDKKHLFPIIEKTPAQVYEETLKGFYQAITSTDTAGQYLQAVMGKFSRPAGKGLSTTGQAITEPSAQGVSRELEMRSRRPPTSVAGLPSGLAPARPEGSPGAVLPPEMLQGPPAGIAAQEQGIREPISSTEALRQRGIQISPYARGVRPNEPEPRAPYVPGGMPPEGTAGIPREDPWQRLVHAQYPAEGTVPTGFASRDERIAAQIESRRKALAAQPEQDKYLPGMGPAAFDRAQERVHQEFELLKRSISSTFTRRQQKEDIHTQRDVADHTAAVDANNAGNVTRDASRGALEERLQGKGPLNMERMRAKSAAEQKARIVRKASIAVNATGEIVAGGGYYTDKFGNKRQRTYWVSNKDKLTAPLDVLHPSRSGLIALAEDAMQQAQFSMKKTDPWYQMMGRKWYAAAKELRDAAVWARDHWTDPELKRTVMTARDQLREQWQMEADNGFRIRRDFNYAPGRYEAELWNDDRVWFGRQKVMGRNFRMPAPFNNYYEAIHAGPYIAKNLDIADLVEHRVRQGRQMVNKNLWYGYLKGTKDNVTGLPIAQEIKRGQAEPIKEKGQILRDKEGNVLASPGKPIIPRGYELVTLDNGRKQLAVLSDYKYAVEAAAGESQIRKTPITREMLHATQYLKHYGILIYDSFHPSRLMQYAAALGGNPVKYNRGRAALEYAPKDLDRAVEVGSVTKADADWAREKIKVNFGKGRTEEVTRQELLRLFLEHGANLGRLQDALFAETKHFLPGVTAMNRWVFQQATRGLMAESLVRNFEVLNAKHPDIPVTTLIRDVAKDMNFFFGSIGRQGVLKSPLLRDMAQMIMLAPQWVEGLAQKESRFYARATGVSSLLGRQGPYLGALGGAMAKGLLFYFGLAQVMNLITRRQLTFQNDEEGHKMDAFIPAGKTGFWLSPMSVFAELSHDVLRLFETKPTAWDVVDQIGRNKLGPWGRMGIVLTTKQNAQGEFIPTTAGRLMATAETLVPVPITGSHLLKTMFGSPTGRVLRSPQPGGFQRQYLASVLGIKVQPGDTPLQRMTRLAQRFMQRQGRQETVEFVPTELPSYSKLRSAIRVGDESGAKALLKDLQKNHTDDQIYHTMRIWASSPLTGSRAHEADFVGSLTPQQQQLYSQAMEERLNTLQSFIDVYVSSQ